MVSSEYWRLTNAAEWEPAMLGIKYVDLAFLIKLLRLSTATTKNSGRAGIPVLYLACR